jgi:type II restriction enzyme
MIKGNKGEWSEIYTLFKLLGDKQIFAGNAELEKIESLFYPIIKIIRTESGGNFEYAIDGDIIVVSGGEEIISIPVKTFSEQAAALLSNIKESNGTFNSSEAELFMNSIYCTSLKAKSTTKTDIRIIIHDKKINQNAELGFSIKSQLGGDSTLLNAGKTTNLIYKISEFNGSIEDVNRINEIDTRSKIKDRIEAIKTKNGKLHFNSIEHDIFKNNLVLIDSLLPNILGELVLNFFSTSLSSLKDLSDVITNENPMAYDTQNSHTFYEYKLKRFLTDVALGMMPSKVWSGVYEATGGYLIVKGNGDILCYHIYNRNQFEDYLFFNTKLETASSSRHEFGKLYFQNEQLYFKLNLQIRFI